jgi:hypothetical protein
LEIITAGEMKAFLYLVKLIVRRDLTEEKERVIMKSSDKHRTAEQMQLLLELLLELPNAGLRPASC